MLHAQCLVKSIANDLTCCYIISYKLTFEQNVFFKEIFYPGDNLWRLKRNDVRHGLGENTET